MSTASQRRKARRLALQAPFAEKVREVALSLPRRRPEPVNGMAYVERMREADIASDWRRVVYLKTTPGEPLPRRMVIPFGESRRPGFLDRMSPFSDEAVRYLEFTWRSWAVRAGDTEVRWFTPELLTGATEESIRSFGAARKASAYVARAIASLEFNIGGNNWLANDMRQAYEALKEFIGELDPDSTRAEREAATNREARGTCSG